MDIKAIKPAPSYSPSPSPSPSSSSTQTTITKSAAELKKRKPYTKKDGSASVKNNNKGERMTFELDDVLRKYSPEQFKTCKAYDVGGVNILNKKPVDSKTALDKIKRRRETHNRVERRRRDCINQLIDELTSLLPKEDDDTQSKCHRVNVLRTAVAHIQNLTHQNENLCQQLEALQTGGPMPPPAIITTLAPMMDYEEEDDSQSLYSDTSPSLPYTSHAPRSPVSPLSAGFFSPASSPRLYGVPNEPGSNHDTGSLMTHLAPLKLSGTISIDAASSSSRPSSPSLLSSMEDMSVRLPSIPMIIEPSESIPSSSPTDSTSNNGTLGSHAKRLNRQTLPRLQLVPPPFHHHRSSNCSNASAAPSHNGQDSLTSPASTYSGYSSASGPWSSSSSSLGPFSANSSIGPHSSYGGNSPRSPGFSSYGPLTPYSPNGPSSGGVSPSLSGYSQSYTSSYIHRQSPRGPTGGSIGVGGGYDGGRDNDSNDNRRRSYDNSGQREVPQEPSVSSRFN